MILVWSKYQNGPADAAVSYLLDPVVRKSDGMNPVDVIRDPVPEVLFGVPKLVAAYIDGLPFKARYRSATLSFSEQDVPVVAFNAGDPKWRRQVEAAVRLFKEVAFAGIPERARPPIFVGTHTHLGRLEVNILLGRGAGVPGGLVRSINPHPPMLSSTNCWDAFTDLVNDVFGWSDPRCPSRRCWISAPGCMEKELAEHLRRLERGEDLRLNLDDPRYRALGLCRAAVRHHGGDRSKVISYLNKGLEQYGWAVTSHSRDGITCGSSRRGGGRVTFRGAALDDDIQDAIDPHDALVARQKYVAKALPRLRQAMQRRAAQNRRIGPWPEHAPTDPLRILTSSAGLQTISSCLRRLITRIMARFRKTVHAMLLAETLTQLPVANLRATADKMEAALERFTQRHRPDLQGRAIDRPAHANAVSRRASARRPDGRISYGIDQDRPEHVGGCGDTNNPSTAVGEHGNASRSRRHGAQSVVRDARHVGEPGPDRGSFGGLVHAHWTRGRWLREVGAFTSSLVGRCRVTWCIDPKRAEIILIRTDRTAATVTLFELQNKLDWRTKTKMKLQGLNAPELGCAQSEKACEPSREI